MVSLRLLTYEVEFRRHFLFEPLDEHKVLLVDLEDFCLSFKQISARDRFQVARCS